MMSRKRVWIVIGVIVGLLIVVAVCFFVVFRKNDYLRINNFDEYYYNVPEKTRKSIFASLYNTVLKNFSGDISSEGAMIRDSEPYLYAYDESYTGYYGEFVVDIPEIQQSYLVKFNYSEDSGSFMGGYSSLVYCLPEDKMIYPDFDCKDNLPFVTEESEENNGSK